MWVKFLVFYAIVLFGACKAQQYEKYTFTVSMPLPLQNESGQWYIQEVSDTFQLYRQEALVMMIKHSYTVAKLDSFDVFGTGTVKKLYFAYLQGEAMGVKVDAYGSVFQKIPVDELLLEFGAKQFYHFFDPGKLRLLEKRRVEGLVTEFYTSISQPDRSYPDSISVQKVSYPVSDLFQLGVEDGTQSVRQLVYTFNAYREGGTEIPRRTLRFAVLASGNDNQPEILKQLERMRKLL
jgi:hypothetical protein